MTIWPSTDIGVIVYPTLHLNTTLTLLYYALEHPFDGSDDAALHDGSDITGDYEGGGEQDYVERGLGRDERRDVYGSPVWEQRKLRPPSLFSRGGKSALRLSTAATAVSSQGSNSNS